MCCVRHFTFTNIRLYFTKVKLKPNAKLVEDDNEDRPHNLSDGAHKYQGVTLNEEGYGQDFQLLFCGVDGSIVGSL